MNERMAVILTASGFIAGVTVGGIAPIILLSGGLGFTIAEIINTIK